MNHKDNDYTTARFFSARLIIFFLDTGDEMPEASSFTLSDTVNMYNSRAGLLNEPETVLKNGLPHSFNLKRNSYGANESLDGFTLVNITAEGNVVYENPFKGARLSDEEIAIATCLLNMKKYLETEIPFYTLRDAALDSKIFLSV